MARPTETVEERLEKRTFDFDKVEEMASYGLTEEQISQVIGITSETLNQWKKDDGFLLALKKGKQKADARVIESLYHRATGYDHADIYFSQFQGTVTQTPYTRHYIPDVTAQIFWLKNRQPKTWRDKVDVGFKDEGDAKPKEAFDPSKLPMDVVIELSNLIKKVEKLQAVETPKE